MLRKWFQCSTLFVVFCTRFFFVAGGLTLFYFYFIVLINLTILALKGYLWLPPRLLRFFAYLFASGFIGLLLGTDIPAGFIKSFLGISICAVYSAALLRYFRFDTAGLFKLYVTGTFYASCFGLLMLPIGSYSHGRLVGPFIEPSAFAIVCTPAVFYYADQWQRTRRQGLHLLVVTLATILTFSSLGFLGLMFGGILFGLRYRFGRVLVPILVVALGLATFQQSTMFQQRIGDTLGGLTLRDVSDINLSSLGVVANTFITERQFETHPLIGGGLGSHFVAHERFIDEILGMSTLPEEYKSLGQWDASSLFLRIVSELGIVGLAYAAWFLWRYFPRHGTPEEKSIAISLLCYVFMKCLRSGEYFGGEQLFFLSIYAINGEKARLRISQSLRDRLRALQRIPAALTLPKNPSLPEFN